MKREYIEPQYKVVQLKMRHMLCASPTGGGVYEKNADSGSAAFARGGNDWDEDDW